MQLRNNPLVDLRDPFLQPLEAYRPLTLPRRPGGGDGVPIEPSNVFHPSRVQHE